MLNVIGIADDILIAGFDEWSKDHDEVLQKLINICRQASLKLNKDKSLFRCLSIPFIGKTISWLGMSPDPSKIQPLTYRPPLKMKKELQSFLGIINYLIKLSPATAGICDQLCKLT